MAPLQICSGSTDSSFEPLPKLRDFKERFGFHSSWLLLALLPPGFKLKRTLAILQCSDPLHARSSTSLIGVSSSSS
ncbi:hypothetical protein AMECASPLE_028238 [Ameca splendens]|uniref:Uncharacterized protein n=1 Tax=Ameca splendens TaxID=208324 RepID=A0ABV1A1S7_9TELE